jgi:hypothetical protein
MWSRQLTKGIGLQVAPRRLRVVCVYVATAARPSSMSTEAGNQSTLSDQPWPHAAHVSVMTVRLRAAISAGVAVQCGHERGSLFGASVIAVSSLSRRTNSVRPSATRGSRRNAILTESRRRDHRTSTEKILHVAAVPGDGRQEIPLRYSFDTRPTQNYFVTNDTLFAALSMTDATACGCDM